MWSSSKILLQSPIYSGDRPAKSDAAILAFAFVVAWRSVADLFHTWAAWVTKVSPPLRGTSTCPVLADRVVFDVAVREDDPPNVIFWSRPSRRRCENSPTSQPRWP
jgi:hypothetical protein